MSFGDGSWDFNGDGKTGFGERMMGEALAAGLQRYRG